MNNSNNLFEGEGKKKLQKLKLLSESYFSLLRDVEEMYFNRYNKPADGDCWVDTFHTSGQHLDLNTLRNEAEN